MVRADHAGGERERARGGGKRAPHSAAPSADGSAGGGGRVSRAARWGSRRLIPRGSDVEDRREDQAEDGDAEHAEDHRGAQRLAHLRARPDRDGQRDHAEDEGEAGHQDRPQARAGGLDGGLEPVHALLLLRLLGELDDQDGVLGGERDQHDQPDLGQDVVVQPAQVHAEHGRQDAHRHDQDDRERQGAALHIARPAPGRRRPRRAGRSARRCCPPPSPERRGRSIRR